MQILLGLDGLQVLFLQQSVYPEQTAMLIDFRFEHNLPHVGFLLGNIWGFMPSGNVKDLFFLSECCFHGVLFRVGPLDVDRSVSAIGAPADGKAQGLL